MTIIQKFARIGAAQQSNVLRDLGHEPVGDYVDQFKRLWRKLEQWQKDETQIRLNPANHYPPSARPF